MLIKLLLFALVAEAGAYLTLGLSHQKIMPKPGKGLKPRPATKIDCDKHINRRHRTLAELGDKYGALFQQNFCGEAAEAAKKEYLAYQDRLHADMMLLDKAKSGAPLERDEVRKWAKLMRKAGQEQGDKIPNEQFLVLDLLMENELRTTFVDNESRAGAYFYAVDAGEIRMDAPQLNSRHDSFHQAPRGVAARVRDRHGRDGRHQRGRVTGHVRPASRPLVSTLRLSIPRDFT